jgi:hypothetical protein
MESSQEFKDFIRQLNESRYPPPPPSDAPSAPLRRKVTTRASSKELHVKDLAVAYVKENPDGSFTQFKLHTTSVQVAWTTIIAETTRNNNQITEMRMAPLSEWKHPPLHGKRVIYANAARVNPNEDLCQFLRQRPIENPVLLVCWENNNSDNNAATTTTAHKNNKKKHCKHKEWHYCLFTGGVDITKPKGGPIILVHTETGTCQLDEAGVNCIASSAFIDWITHKVNNEEWEVISLTNLSASVRVKIAEC